MGDIVVRDLGIDGLGDGDLVLVMLMLMMIERVWWTSRAAVGRTLMDEGDFADGFQVD